MGVVVIGFSLLFIGIGLFCFYLEYSIYFRGYYAKGKVIELKGSWKHGEYGKSYYYRPVIKFIDQEGKELIKYFEPGIHSAYLLPNEGDRINVFYYEGKLYQFTIKKILFGLFWLSLGSSILYSIFY